MVSGLVSYTPLLFNGSKMSLSPGLIVNAILEILLFCSVNQIRTYNKADQTERGYEPRAKPRRALFYKVFRGFHHVIIHINMVLFFIIYNFVNDTFKG